MNDPGKPLTGWQRRVGNALTGLLLAVSLLLAMLGVAHNQIGETLFGAGLFLSLLPWWRMPEVYFFRLHEPLRRGVMSDGIGRLLQVLAVFGLALLALALGGRLLGYLLS